MQHLGGTNPLPGGGNLDQDALAADSGLLVETDEITGFIKGSGSIKGETGIDLGADAARYDFQNLQSKEDQRIIDDLVEMNGAGKCRALVIGNRLVEQTAVFRLKNRFENQRGVGRGILRCKFPNGFKISRVGNNGGELLKVFELV